MIEQYFFELLQVAIGNRLMLSVVPSAEEWQSIYDLSKKQALTGIAFRGCEKLPAGQRPPMLLFIKWSGMAIKLKEKNQDISQKCVEVTEMFKRDGFDACVLKGQGNLANYPEDLGCYRTPGDIDVWLTPSVSYKKPIRSVVDYVNSIASGRFICYIHTDFSAIRGTEIEVHIRPSFLCSPLRNKRLQKWFDDEKTRSFPLRGGQTVGDSISFPIPSNSFNAVYQLLHIYKHLFEEGIGLRQILDYYFVIKRLMMKDEGSHSMNDRRLRMKDEIMNTLERFGMKKFAGAIMYVLQTVFAMPQEYMLCAPDKREGQFLLNEIMQAGNFGKHDTRISHDGGKTKHAWEKLKHNFRLVGHYPEEVLWEPVFRVYHWIWRRFDLWRFE